MTPEEEARRALLERMKKVGARGVGTVIAKSAAAKGDKTAKDLQPATPPKVTRSEGFKEKMKQLDLELKRSRIGEQETKTRETSSASVATPGSTPSESTTPSPVAPAKNPSRRLGGLFRGAKGAPTTPPKKSSEPTVNDMKFKGGERDSVEYENPLLDKKDTPHTPPKRR